MSELLPVDLFTHREKRVARYLLFGKSRAEIAATMCLSEHTIKTHTQNIFKKAEVKNQKEFMIKYLLEYTDSIKAFET